MHAAWQRVDSEGARRSGSLGEHAKAKRWVERIADSIGKRFFNGLLSTKLEGRQLGDLDSRLRCDIKPCD